MLEGELPTRPQLAEFTRTVEAHRTPPEGIDRREWISSNLSSMRALLDPVLERAGQGLGPLRPAMQIMAGAALSAEVGIVVGYLAQRVLGQYELVLLDEASAGDAASPPRLLFVMPNLGSAVRALDVPGEEFLRWVTLHEVTHAVQFSGVPWLQGYLAGLVAQLMRSAELRMDGPRRPTLPSRAALRRGVNAIRSGDVIGAFASPQERETLARVQTAMAVVEGHAEHVMDAVAPDLLPSLSRLRTALDRRRSSQSGPAKILGRLLGLEMKMRQYEQGKAFCDAIVAAAGPEALSRVFAAPTELPTLAELTDPPAWLRRVGLDGGALPAGDQRSSA